MRGLGYTVLEAGDGAEALGILEAHGASVALVLSDVVMPVMSGPAFGARLATLHPGTPILFMSGYAQEEIVGQGLLEPHQRRLRKPFSQAALAAAVASLLDVKAGTA